MLLVGHGHEHGCGDRPSHLDQPGPHDAGQQTRQADGDAHAREGPLAVGGEGVIAAAGAHRAEVLVPGHERFVDGAGVVVQTASDLQVGHDGARTTTGSDPQQRFQLVQARQQERTGLGSIQGGQDAGAQLIGVGTGHGGQAQGGLCLGARDADGLDEFNGDGVGSDLVELVHHAQHLDEPVVLDTHGLVEALGDLAVGHVDGDGRDREGGQGLVHDQGDFDVVVQGQAPVADDIDVHLVELAEAALLGALPAPDLLDLVALEGEVKDTGVIDDITREGDGEIEVEAELLGGIRLTGFPGTALQAGQEIDLLGGLALPGQFGQRLDGAGLDAAEAVKLEGTAQDVDELLFDHAARREPLGEAGERGECLSCLCGVRHGRHPLMTTESCGPPAVRLTRAGLPRAPWPRPDRDWRGAHGPWWSLRRARGGEPFRD